MDKPVVFVFARAPRHGAVKTRLARDIGATEALRFYRHALHGIVRRLTSDGRLDVILAVTPDEAVNATGIWPRGVARIGQGRGDLGRRMLRVLKCAGARPAFVVGSDIPEADARHVLAAARVLGKHRHVLGPTDDGGYWIIGVRHPLQLDIRRLDGVRWSSPHALADSVSRLGDAGLLPERLADVDDGASWSGFKARERLHKRVHV